MKLYRQNRITYNNALFSSLATGKIICQVDVGDVVFLLEVSTFEDTKVYYPAKSAIGWLLSGGVTNDNWELLEYVN